MRWKRSARSFGSSHPAVTMVFHSRSITSSRPSATPRPFGACTHLGGLAVYMSSPHKWLQAPKGSGFLYVRDEVIDRLWNTIVTAGWDEPKLRAERFQRIGSSNVPALWGLRAAVQLANQIGMEKIERRHRQMADYILKEMVQRGTESWTSPDPARRCAIAAGKSAPVPMTANLNML